MPIKVLAHLLLIHICSHLLKHQLPEQSGFTPVKSTVDCNQAFHVLVARRLEFRQRFFAPYVDHKKAFHSVHREAQCDLPRFCGIHVVIDGLIDGLYTGIESSVNCVGGGASSFL